MFVWLAYGVILLHFVFIFFVTLGGFLLFRHPGLAYVHLPCVAWGVLVEVMHWPCPLAPLEQWLRAKGGMGGYQEDFLSHYLLAFIYPEGLTLTAQLVLGIALLLINIGIYGYVFWWHQG